MVLRNSGRVGSRRLEARRQPMERSQSVRGDSFFCFYLSIYVFLQIMDSPLVLSMCDTLLQRSEESGDKHMQIISYCIKLDYFYYKNDEENILKQTDEVKKVCLRLDNLKYYYFAWGGRLITYY